MIWVVTEHTDTRHTLLRLIGAKGYQVVEIDCGDDVIRRLRFQTPSLIILDCGVPGSFGMLLNIRSEPRARPIPVVMFSIDDQNQKDKCLLAGADAYVAKGSLDWAELLLEVVRFAELPPGAASGQAQASPDNK